MKAATLPPNWRDVLARAELFLDDADEAIARAFVVATSGTRDYHIADEYLRRAHRLYLSARGQLELVAEHTSEAQPLVEEVLELAGRVEMILDVSPVQSAEQWCSSRREGSA